MKKLLVPLCMLLSGACALAAAACEETTHTVTFNANYGQFDDATSSRSVLVKDKKKVEEQTPTREGWKFEYWALNGQEYNFEDKVEGSFTLDAVYTPVDFHTVSFTPVEGADFYYEGVNYNVTDWNNVPTIEIKVTVELDAFYAGTPVLMANDVSYNPVDGAYIIPINADTTITAVGVADDVSNMSGNGTEAEPFLVSRPIDLIKIAQEVNEGDEVYRTAFYQLQNDIDLKGHELNVIGNGQDLANGDFAYFAGSFSGMGYTIKNFEINTDGSEYAGLFGVVNAGSITHLNIEDYTINATVNDSAVYCGSFVGYGIGANVLVCGTKNGTLNVNAAENYFSYVGGAIGFQYSAYDPNLDVSYVSAASYLSIHTRIYANSGLIYSAGGIVGYAACENEFTPSYVNHCYTNSIVTGAVVSGGVVGYLGRYASIVDCYATGDVWAQNPSALGIEEFEYVYAGGIVGYAENDTVVYESFATGSVNAYSSKGEAYQNANGLVGGNDPQNFVEMGTNAVLLQNCYYALNGKNGTVDLTSTEFLKTNLNWKDYDWTFVEGQYPTVNLEGTSTTFRVTIEFGAGNTVDGYTKNVIPITDIYLPFGMWVKNGDFKATYLSDGGKMASGYYFDAAFEKPVPTGYIPTRDVTLYVNFSNYAEVAGQYFLLNAHTSNVVPLTLNTDGTYSYVDGNNTYSSTYVYNDKDQTILFKDARFSRYAETDSTALDRYMLRDYAATFSSGTLTITDNAFFTAQSPLIAKQGGFVVGEYYIVKDGNANLYTFYSNNTGVSVVNGVRTEFTYALNEDVIYVNNAEFATYSNGTIISSDGEFSKMDAYKGVWEQTSTVRKELSLDGMGNWSYVHYVNVKAGNSIQKNILDQAAGTYTVEDSSILFYQQSTLLADGAFNEDGFLCVMDETFYRENSFKGVWQDFYHGATLTLNGITNAGYGEGSLLYDNKNQPITYVAELDSELVSVYLNGDVFLTFTFDELNDNLIVEFNLQDNLRDDTVLRMFRYDEYFGEWISNNPIFEIVSFNGFGAYNTIYTAEQNSVALSGELTLFIDNEEVKVPYALEDPTSLAASFTYEGIEYTLTFDLSTGKATVSGGVSDVVLERKDDFAEVELISQNGAIYSFDGRGNLASKGTMTVRNGKTVQTFLYAINGENVDVSLPSTPNTVAYSIVKDGSVYRFSTDNTVELKIYTAFTGTWAMSESFETFTVSGRDLNGTITGVYKNTNVVFEQIDEYTLKFKHNNSDLYLLALEYEGLAVSLYPAIYAGSFTICARVDDLFGDWKKISGPFELTLSFDGMSNSNYQPGCAVIKHRDTAVYYNYLITPDNDIILYAMQALNNKYYNYVVQWVDSSDPLAYTNGEQYFRLIEIDALFKTTLTYNDVDYTFDGQGTATDEHGNTYTYEIKNFTMDKNNKTYVSVTVELEKDGVKQTITFEL